MGKTQSKPLAARHGRGTAWARQATCESAFRSALRGRGNNEGKKRRKGVIMTGNVVMTWEEQQVAALDFAMLFALQLS